MGCELISSSVHSDQNVNFKEDILLHIMYILSTYTPNIALYHTITHSFAMQIGPMVRIGNAVPSAFEI